MLMRQSSVGYPDSGWFNVHERNMPYGFHNTTLTPNIKNAFQALALGILTLPHAS